MEAAWTFLSLSPIFGAKGVLWLRLWSNISSFTGPLPLMHRKECLPATQLLTCEQVSVWFVDVMSDTVAVDAGDSVAEVPQEEEQPIQSAPDKLPPPSYIPTPKFDEDGHDDNIDGFAGMDLAPAKDPLGPPPDLAVPTEAVESQVPMVVEPVVAEVRRPSNHFPVGKRLHCNVTRVINICFLCRVRASPS